jgi:HAE1 family hydrophobic/amphiphilic exporter-1
VILAIVVLAVSYQRMQVDQFPNIDFPVVVISADYPCLAGDRRKRVTKIEEGVNSIAGISSLTSRSYEGQSLW